jgi:Xaa-Pro aminopeptidase
MEKDKIDLIFVFGDEYRRENLRYTADFWPIYDRGGVLIPKEGEPISLAAPESEAMVTEMSVYQDIRLLPFFACSYVGDTIDYPLAKYDSFENMLKEYSDKFELKTIGIVGRDIMPIDLYMSVEKQFAGYKIVDAKHILTNLRMTKSEYEIECFRKSHQIADEAYKAIIKACTPGVTELAAASHGEKVAFSLGSEKTEFLTLMSGDRCGNVVARSSEKVIEDGDMIMVSLAVQYKGYISTIAFPFVVGMPSEKQIELIDILMEASDLAQNEIKAGTPQGESVRAVNAHFNAKGCSQYNLYPPLHGAGLAEAENPYPDENTQRVFVKDCIVNSDISLFRHPGGSNRIEEGLLVTDKGCERLSGLVPNLMKDWKEIRGIRLSTIL